MNTLQSSYLQAKYGENSIIYIFLLFYCRLYLERDRFLWYNDKVSFNCYEWFG